ncbi:MAG TPA: LysM peptidoglycan-binding domain-containing protein [Chloroflexota bacterium]
MGSTTGTAAGAGGSTGTAGGATAASVSGAAGGGDLGVASGPYRAYRVQPGDTLRFVAELYGVSPASIAQASGLPNADRLRVGQVLTVPSQPGWLYRVQPGETLDQIAARSGVAGELIASASALSAASVAPGDVILIPDQSVARSK